MSVESEQWLSRFLLDATKRAQDDNRELMNQLDITNKAPTKRTKEEHTEWLRSIENIVTRALEQLTTPEQQTAALDLLKNKFAAAKEMMSGVMSTPSTTSCELNGYDCIVHVNPLTNVFDKGWTFQFKKSAPLHTVRHDSMTTVYIIGHFNVGKTWLLSRLANKPELLMGVTVKTEGISLVAVNTVDPTKSAYEGSNNKILFVDTAGQNSAVLDTDYIPNTKRLERRVEQFGSLQGRMMVALEDMQAEENLIREVAFRFSQVLLVVVELMNHKDQVNICRLVKIVTETMQRKEVIVVHNLRRFEPSTIGGHINEVKKIFNGDASLVNGVCMITNCFQLQGNGRVQTASLSHVFLCNDHSHDGQVHNNLVLEHLNRRIGIVKGHGEESVLDSMTLCLSQALMPLVECQGLDLIYKFDEDKQQTTTTNTVRTGKLIAKVKGFDASPLTTPPEVRVVLLPSWIPLPPRPLGLQVVPGACLNSKGSKKLCYGVILAVPSAAIEVNADQQMAFRKTLSTNNPQQKVVFRANWKQYMVSRRIVRAFADPESVWQKMTVLLTVSQDDKDILQNNRTVKQLSEPGVTGFRVDTGIRGWDVKLDEKKIPMTNFIYADGCVGILFITHNSPPML